MQALASYWNLIPEHTGREMAYTFMAGCVLGILLDNDVKFGILSGVLSTTATAVSSLATPFFREDVPPHQARRDDVSCEIIRTSIGIVAANTLGIALGNPPNYLCNAVVLAYASAQAVSGMKGGDLSNANGILSIPSFG